MRAMADSKGRSKKDVHQPSESARDPNGGHKNATTLRNREAGRMRRLGSSPPGHRFGSVKLGGCNEKWSAKVSFTVHRAVNQKRLELDRRLIPTARARSAGFGSLARARWCLIAPGFGLGSSLPILWQSR